MTPNKPPGDGRAAAVISRWRTGKRGRISNGLVGLSSAAIVSVYAVGYVRTQAAEEQLTAPATAAAVVRAPAQGSGRAPGALVSPVPTSSPSAARPQQVPPTTAPGPTRTPAQTGYRDGTYTGSGTSRHGGVGVTIVVKGGSITSAQITDCQTRYPCSKISALPGQVVARQSAQVNYVSGATDSSMAYRQAVANALAQAI